MLVLMDVRVKKLHRNSRMAKKKWFAFEEDISFEHQFWPDVTSHKGVEKAVRTGRWAAIFVAIMAAGALILYFIGKLPSMNIAMAITSFSVFSGVAFATRIKSRAAALLGFCFYVVEQLYFWSQTGEISLFVVLAISFMLFQGVRGSFGHARMSIYKDAFD